MEVRLIVFILITISITNQVNCFQKIKKPVSDNNRIDINEKLLTETQSKNNIKESSVETRTSDSINKSDVPHSRKKRLLWITNDGRLALPPGTSLVITPSLSMPLVRHPLDGFFSNISVSLPVTVDFDKLGLTDNENPFGDLPPFFDRSFGRSLGQVTADLVAKFIENRRRRIRSVEGVPKHVQQRVQDMLHGGERALLFSHVEDMLSNFGIDGKPCLLRAICEVHAHPLTNFGLLGEMLKLFLTASKSPYSHLLDEYVEAEKAGSGNGAGPGECWPYFKDCSKSLFISKKNKYTEDAEKRHELDEISDNGVNSEIELEDLPVMHE